MAAIALGVVFHAGARLGMHFTIEGTAISVFWAPNAITLAALLLVPMQWWPWLVVGSWVGDLTAEATVAALPMAVLYAATNAVQTLGCAALLRYWGTDPIATPRNYLLLAASYVGLAAPVGATIVVAVAATSAPADVDLWAVWCAWWMGDSLYVLTLTPLILGVARDRSAALQRRPIEATLLIATLLTLCWLEFGVLFVNNFTLSNAVLLPLLWAALRFGVTGTAAAGTFITMAAGISALSLSPAVIAAHVLNLQLVLVGNATSALFLAVVSERWHRAEQRLREALGSTREALDTAERACVEKSKFLAAASHDLRQPFQAMVLYTSLLQENLTLPANRRAMSGLSSAIQAGEELLNSVLHISALDAGAIQPARGMVTADAVLADMIQEFKAVVDSRNLTLRYVPCRALLWTDSVLLRRVVRNLVANAVKYTPSGTILVGCRSVGQAVRIEVWDTGQGVPEAMQPVIWQEFSQLGNVERDQSKGVGLGLSIVAKIGQVLSHPVGMRSRPGKGSVFFVVVPKASV